MNFYPCIFSQHKWWRLQHLPPVYLIINFYSVDYSTLCDWLKKRMIRFQFVMKSFRYKLAVVKSAKLKMFLFCHWNELLLLLNPLFWADAWGANFETRSNYSKPFMDSFGNLLKEKQRRQREGGAFCLSAFELEQVILIKPFPSLFCWLM